MDIAIAMVMSEEKKRLFARLCGTGEGIFISRANTVVLLAVGEIIMECVRSVFLNAGSQYLRFRLLV